MSLENFFTMPKKRETRKKNIKSTASEALANPGDDTESELANEEEPESYSEPGEESTSLTSSVVQQMTRNIEKMLDKTR